MYFWTSTLKSNYSEGEYPRIETFTPLPQERCKQTRFANLSKEDNSNWRCAKQTNYTIEKGLNYKTIMVTLTYCNNATLSQFFPNLTCKTREETDAIIPYVAYLFAHLESYFDVEDFTTPIKFNLKAY